MISGKDYASIAYTKSVKLEKDKIIQDNYLYAQKIQRFNLPKRSFYQSYSKGFLLQCEEGSCANIQIFGELDNEVTLELLINDVLILSQTGAKFNIIDNVTVSNLCNIVIKLTSDTSRKILNFVLKINAKFKNGVKSDKRTIKGTRNFLLVLNKLDGDMYYDKYVDFDSFKNGIKTKCGLLPYANIIDTDYCIDPTNANAVKQECFLLKSGSELDVKIGDLVSNICNVKVDVACISFLKSSTDALVQVIYSIDNVITVCVVKCDGTIVNTYTITPSVKSPIKLIGSIVNSCSSYVNGFYFLTANNEVYLCVRSTDTGEFCTPFKCGMGEDSMAFMGENKLYLFTYMNNCLDLQVFSVTTDDVCQDITRYGVYKYYNCQEGFVYDGNIYVICDDIVTQVEIE